VPGLVGRFRGASGPARRSPEGLQAAQPGDGLRAAVERQEVALSIGRPLSCQMVLESEVLHAGRGQAEAFSGLDPRQGPAAASSQAVEFPRLRAVHRARWSTPAGRSRQAAGRSGKFVPQQPGSSFPASMGSWTWGASTMIKVRRCLPLSHLFRQGLDDSALRQGSGEVGEHQHAGRVGRARVVSARIAAKGSPPPVSGLGVG